MKIIGEYKYTEKAKIEPGACFIGRVREGTVVGIGLAPSRDAGKMFIAVYSDENITDKKVRLYAHSAINSEKVIVFPHAKIIPNISVDNINTFFPHYEFPAGFLLIDRERFYISAAVSQTTNNVYSLDDYSIYNVETYECIFFSSWKIVIPDANGKYVDLCEVNATIE